MDEKSKMPQGAGKGSGPGPEMGRGTGQPADEEELRSFKEFRLTSYAIDHKTSVFVLFFIIMLGGLISYARIPKESFPEMEIPMIAVNTIYPGVAPADMETLVTRPIEDELNTIADIEELTSTSIEGYSSVVAEFSTTVDLEDALQKVREKVGGRTDDRGVQLRRSSHHAGEPLRRVRTGSPQGTR
jgi:hypothetical protein